MKNWIGIICLFIVLILLYIGGGMDKLADSSRQSGHNFSFHRDNTYLSDNSSCVPLFSGKEEINQITSPRIPVNKTNKYQNISYSGISTKELFGKYIIRRYIYLTIKLFIKFRKCDITFPFHFFS